MARRGTSRASRRFIVRGGAGLFFDRPPASPNVYETSQNPPFTRNVTLRYGKLQDLGSTGLQTEAAAGAVRLAVRHAAAGVRAVEHRRAVLDAVQRGVDVSYTGQHSYNTLAGVNINNIDLGSAYLSKFADPTQATPTRRPTRTCRPQPNLVRYYRGLLDDHPAAVDRLEDVSLDPARDHAAAEERLAFGFNDTMQLSDKQFVAPRLQHNADGTITVRDDQAMAQELFGNNAPAPHVMRAHFTWDLPDLQAAGGVSRVLGYIVNDWSLSGIWNGQSGRPTTPRSPTRPAAAT